MILSSKIVFHITMNYAASAVTCKVNAPMVATLSPFVATSFDLAFQYM